MNKKQFITSPVYLILIFLTVAYLFGACFIFYFSKHQMQIELNMLRAEKIADAKENLKNYVDIMQSVLESNYLSITQEARLSQMYGGRIKSVIQVVDSILKAKEQDVRLGNMTQEQAKRVAQEQISQINYEPAGSYIWTIDTGRPYPKMISNPIAPELNGRILDDVKFNCANGKQQNFFQASVDIAQQNPEGGFVNYFWPKKNTANIVIYVPKLSYVKLFKPWNWIIGTGIHLDDVIGEIIKLNTDVINVMRYNHGVNYFFVLSNELPYPRVLIQPLESSLIGKYMDDPGVLTKDKKEQLFTHFVNLCRTQGEGFVEYKWTQQTKNGVSEKINKLSYIKLYKPLDWIIGSGVSLNTVDEMVAKKQSVQQAILTTYLINLGLAYVVLIAAFLFFIYIIRDKLLSHKMF